VVARVEPRVDHVARPGSEPERRELLDRRDDHCRRLPRLDPRPRTRTRLCGSSQRRRSRRHHDLDVRRCCSARGARAHRESRATDRARRTGRQRCRRPLGGRAGHVGRCARRRRVGHCRVGVARLRQHRARRIQPDPGGAARWWSGLERGPVDTLVRRTARSPCRHTSRPLVRHRVDRPRRRIVRGR